MVNKEKQIEEIAKEIHYGYWETCGKDSCADCPANFHNVCEDKLIAEKLYNLGYRKIPEGSVVLSKEEWETLHNDYAKALYNARCDERKETAREILEAIKLKAWGNNADVNGNIWSYSISIYELAEIAKQFGVEVEE